MGSTVTASQSLNGMLVVNKPAGMISKDVSRWLERRLGKVRMGHVGTLDPLAEGVLPILLGKATRLQDYLLGGTKAYEFDVLFGKTTDTLDCAGTVIAERPWEHITTEALLAIIPSLEGDIEQVPPVYSAIKYKGEPLYEYARSGRADELPLADMLRRVTVHSLTMLKHEGNQATFKVLCSKGTYVRSIAAKIGEKVESCGMVTRLVRQATSGVSLSDAHALSHLEERLSVLDELIIPINELKLGLSRWQANEEETRRLLTGQRLRIDSKCFAEKVLHDMGGDADNKEWVLVDDKASAFGIGLTRNNEQESLIVTMKRGLL